jgi:hypothetical protein
VRSKLVSRASLDTHTTGSSSLPTHISQRRSLRFCRYLTNKQKADWSTYDSVSVGSHVTSFMKKKRRERRGRKWVTTRRRRKIKKEDTTNRKETNFKTKKRTMGQTQKKRTKRRWIAKKPTPKQHGDRPAWYTISIVDFHNSEMFLCACSYLNCDNNNNNSAWFIRNCKYVTSRWVDYVSFLPEIQW